MKMSILAKIVAMLLLSIFITGLGMFFTTKYFMSVGFENEAQVNLKNMERTVTYEIESLKEKYLHFSTLIADNPRLIQYILNNDVKSLRELAVRDQERTNAQFLTIADAKGDSIVRSHSQKRGDNIRSQAVIRSALDRGQAAVMIEPGTAVRFSLRAASPIRHEGKIIGAVVLGEALDTNR